MNQPLTIEAFTNVFEKFNPQLKSYLLRMTASVQDTEDIVQDTWIKAGKNLSSFEEKSSLKTWVFSDGKDWWVDVPAVCQ